MDQVVNLSRDDDILLVHSEIEWSGGRRVIVVVPRGAKALSSEFEIQLVRRWADESNVLVGLVTNDLAVQEMADHFGLPHFSTIGRAQKGQWKWPSTGEEIPTRATALDDEEKGTRQPILQRLGLTGFQLLFTFLLFAGSTIIIGVTALLFVPSVRITIVPASLAVTDSREVILDPTVTTIDQINGIIPTSSVRREISGTATIATSKLNTAPADRANGEVVFTNVTGTPSEIPVGTIVETSSGVTVRFSTSVTVELSSGYNSRATAPVTAVDPGPEGNVKPLQINVIEGPLSSVVRVINTSATTGGSIKQVHVVTFDDKTLLRQRLGDELRTAAVAKLQDESGTDIFIPPASVQVSVLSESFDHLVDDPSDSLSLHIEAIAIGAGVDPADLQTFAERALGEKVPKGYAVLPGTLRVEPDVNARVEANSVILTLSSSEQATPIVNSAEVLKGLNGKPITEAEALIASRVRLAGRPLIEISPSWWKFMPFFDFRIAFFVHSAQEALTK
jgi:hypothetical protein